MKKTKIEVVNSTLVLYIVSLFILTRAALFIFGNLFLNQWGFLPRYFERAENNVDYGETGRVFRGWDSDWYLSIANNGYSKDIKNIEGMYKMNNFAFFPLYPLTSKLVGSVFGNNIIGGIMISNVSLLASGFLIYLLAREKLGRGYGSLAVKFLFLFPTSFIFSAIQSESLFLCLLLAFFLALSKKVFFMAGVFGYLLALTKSIGFFVFIPLIYEYVISIKKEKKPFKLDANSMGIVLPILGVITFVIYSYFLTGDMFVVYNTQSAWGKYINLNPFVFLSVMSRQSGVAIYSITLALGMVTCALIGARSLGFSYNFMVWAFSLIHIVSTTLFWHTFSYSRYTSILFPAIFAIAMMAKKSKSINIAITVFVILLQYYIYRRWIIGWPVVM